MIKKYFSKNFFHIAYYLILIFIVFVALFFRLNAKSIYAGLGNFYYKHNNIQKAQLFYEKAFDQGNTDYKIRDAYVNSIINSPLTISAQEKLVKIAEGSIQDVATEKAKSFLYDLMREIHSNYPDNYIIQASYNQKILHWNKIPITYSFKNAQYAPPEFITEIENAFSTWEKESKHRVIFNRIPDNSDIEIEFKSVQKDKIDYDNKYVVAYTNPVINGKKLNKMEMKFYTQTPEGTMFTPNQIYDTALHEIFHALGFMGHSANPNNIMFMSKNNSSKRVGLKAELTEADLSTLELLYKTKPDITNEGNMKYDYIPYLILGDNEIKNVSKRREAKNYIYHAPTLPNGYIDLAESLVAEGRYTDAIKKLEKALYLADSDDVKYVVFYNLAVCHFYITNYEMAEDYTKLAQNIKDSDELHYLLAEIYLKSGNEKSAEKEYLYLANKDTANLDYVTSLANFYINKHDYLKARKLIKNYLKNNPNEKDNKRITQYGLLLF